MQPADGRKKIRLRVLVVFVSSALLAALSSPGAGQAPRLVRVAVQFQHSGQQSREGVQGQGRVIITERGQVRPRASAGAGSSQSRVRTSTSIFTLVQDGGESSLTVASDVPYQQIAFYRDYATGSGHVTSSVIFREVGTSLKVRANLLPGNQVRVRLTPTISWLSADGSGAIEFTEAATEVVVASGQPLVIGGSTTETHAVTREILGIGTRDGGSETTVILTATAQ
jgi:type II secretory pathway component GspD/PulD (secretin)